MQLRKKKTAEELRRRKGVSDYVHKVGRGFKQLGTEILTPASKAGGALISAYKGEPLDITSEELTLAVLSGVVGGKPGGLPAGAVGTGMTRDAALKTLGKSAAKLRPRRYGQSKRVGRYFIPTENVRGVAAGLRKTPKELFEPLTSVKFTDRLPPPTTARNVRIGQRPGGSKIQLAPKAGTTEWFHELTHSAAAKGQAGARAEGKPNIQQYMSDLLESTTTMGDDIVARTPSMKGRSFYRNQPIETHARGVGEALTKYGKDFTEKQFSRLFTNTAKKVMHDVGKKAPKLYKKSATTVGKHYKNIRKTDDDLLKELNIKNPKSKKRLTPGEMARALQDAAEAKGPPMYLRRKAGAPELPKDIKLKPGKKPFKIRRMAD